MKKFLSYIIVLILIGCSNSVRMGTGVDITFDPRTIGMQIDDEIMQKSLKSKIFLIDAKYAVTITIEVLDGRIFLSGDVDDPETKIQITKHAWETKGVRSVKNLLTIKGDTKFKTNVQDGLITTQLRTALILDKKTKSRNYTLETINQNVYIFGIAMDKDEKKKVIEKANSIYDVKKVIPSIYLVSELSRNQN